MANVEIELNVVSEAEETSQNIRLGKSFIKNLESLSQTTDRPNEIFYGVLQSSGSVEIVDRDKNILNAINNGEISNSSLPISIYANGKQVQRHVVKDSSYDTITNTLTMELTNSLEEWSNIQYGGYSYPETEKPAYDLLVDCLSILYDNEQIDKMLDTIIVYGTNNEEGAVKDYLQRIIIQYPYLESATLLDTVNKFCTLAQLQVYQNDSGEIKFVSARPIATSSEIENPIAIPQNRQISQFAETKLLKNKYTNVTIGEKQVEDKTYYNTKIYENGILASNLIFKEGVFNSVDSFARLDTFYIEGSFKIPKIENYGLLRRLNINTNKFDYSVNGRSDYFAYAHCSNTNTIVDFMKNTSKSIGFSNYELWADFKPYEGQVYAEGKVYEHLSYIDQKDYNGNDLFDLKYDSDEKKIIYEFLNTTISENDLSYVKILEETNDYFIIEYKILSQITATGLNFPLSGEVGDINYQCYEVRAQSITIDIYGDKREIILNDINVGDNQALNSENLVSLDGSELLQSGTKYALTKMSDVIIDNIKNDYRIGIEDASTKVVCDNYEYTNGIIAKNWLNGELIKPLDIVRVNKDNLGNSISSYKDGTPRIWKVTERNFNKTGVPLCGLRLQELYTRSKTPLFKTMSWEEINNIAQSGYANLYFRVGDTREITFNDGKKGKLVILGFDHDDLSDGSGKAKMTLGLANLVPNTLMAMNETNTNSGGWSSSHMRNTNMNTIMELLPAELSLIIKSVDKKSLSGDGSKEITTTSDKLWLFSRVEIEGITDNYYVDEGSQYAYWNTIRNGKFGKDRLKSIIETDPTAWYDWWLRTAHATSAFSTFHCYSAPNGSAIVNYGATTELGVCFGFCI